MTNEEFYELARQRNAIMTPEESEKCRRETAEFLERYQLNSDWLGDPYFVDTHNPLHVFLDKCHTGVCFVGLMTFIFWAILYTPVIFLIIIALILSIF
jgi:hypothetical protein